MSMALQITITISLVVIAFYFLLLTALTIAAYLKLRALQKYISGVMREKVEITFGHVDNIAQRLEELSSSTSRKVEDLTDVLPEIRDRLQEIVDLLDLVQEKLKNPLFSLISSLKIVSDKVNRWI